MCADAASTPPTPCAWAFEGNAANIRTPGPATISDRGRTCLVNLISGVELIALVLFIEEWARRCAEPVVDSTRIGPTAFRPLRARSRDGDRRRPRRASGNSPRFTTCAHGPRASVRNLTLLTDRAGVAGGIAKASSVHRISPRGEAIRPLSEAHQRPSPSTNRYSTQE